MRNTTTASRSPNCSRHRSPNWPPWPGTFETAGYADGVSGGWQIRSALRIVGAGKDITTLKLVNASTNGKHYVAIGHALTAGDPLAPNPADSCEVSDLTIDCDLEGQSATTVACGAIRLMGNHVKVQRVKAINWGTVKESGNPGVPCFVIAVLTGDHSSAGRVEAANTGIESCVAVEPAACGEDDVITVFHVGGKEAAGANAEVFGEGPYLRNCFVDCGALGTPMAFMIHALSMGWCRATEGEDSEVLAALGYVIKSKRRSGLHRGSAATAAESAPVVQPLNKAA